MLFIFQGITSRLLANVKDASSLLDFYYSIRSLVLVKVNNAIRPTILILPGSILLVYCILISFPYATPSTNFRLLHTGILFLEVISSVMMLLNEHLLFFFEVEVLLSSIYYLTSFLMMFSHCFQCRIRVLKSIYSLMMLMESCVPSRLVSAVHSHVY